MEDFEFKEVRDYDDTWFRVEYTKHEVSLSFKAFRVTGMSEKHEDWKVEPEADWEGFVKWDGCMEISGRSHFCQRWHIKNYQKLLEDIYDRAKSLFPDIDD